MTTDDLEQRLCSLAVDDGVRETLVLLERAGLVLELPALARRVNAALERAMNGTSFGTQSTGKPSLSASRASGSGIA